MQAMLNIGKSGAQAFQQKINMNAQNISNVNTLGYKRGSVSFKDLMYTEASNYPVNGNLADYNRGNGVRGEVKTADFSQGSFLIDQSSTSYAIQGDGYFGVLNPNTNQIELTRDGAFSRNAEGVLVDAQGNAVQTETLVLASGEVVEQPLLYLPTQTALMTQLPQNRYAVAPENLMVSTQNPNLFGTVNQGMLENSNVDLATEMTDLMVAQRAYSMNLKAVQTADETWQTINQLR